MNKYTYKYSTDLQIYLYIFIFINIFINIISIINIFIYIQLDSMFFPNSSIPNQQQIIQLKKNTNKYFYRYSTRFDDVFSKFFNSK